MSLVSLHISDLVESHVLFPIAFVLMVANPPVDAGVPVGVSIGVAAVGLVHHNVGNVSTAGTPAAPPPLIHVDDDARNLGVA